jgi:hypothetical protein
MKAKGRVLATMTGAMVLATISACLSDGSGQPFAGTCGDDRIAECGGACVDLDNDWLHCGACGKSCAPGQICSKGACAAKCSGGTSECDGACVDTRVDGSHCGKCKNACGDGEVCNGGACTTACGSGTTACGKSCVDVAVNPKHCGGCGMACDAGKVCDKGKCRLFCSDELSDCSGACVDTKNDSANCGACFKVCGKGEACVAGQCTFSCPSGTIACGTSCRNTQVDDDNCGGCDKKCSAGQKCMAGSCCKLGESSCNGQCSDLATDAKNCGGCGIKCDGDQICAAGKCKFRDSCRSILESAPASGDGAYTLDVDGDGPEPSFNAHCDMQGGGWTLVARFSTLTEGHAFSSPGERNWTRDNGHWWFKKTSEAGATASRSDAQDMISRAFWTVKADELRLSRNDFDDDYPLLTTNGACLGTKTFRSFISSFGDFMNGWPSSPTIKGSCSVSYANNYLTTAGFSEAACNGPTLKANSLSFFTSYQYGQAVMMIGGDCNGGDHGIGIIHYPGGWGKFNNPSRDFGDDSFADTGPSYALNMFVR